MQEREAVLGFSLFPGIGPARFRLLVQTFASAKGAWNASEAALSEIGLPNRILPGFLTFRKTLSLPAYTEQMEQSEIRFVACTDPDYPKRLLEIPDPPIGLFVKGKAPLSLLSSTHMIAVVGTRKVSAYGRQMTALLSRELSEAGYVVVSGMALGVDGIAHETVLQAKGKTVAVLGCGVDVIAPASHARLYHSIQENGGLIVSEMPMRHRPDKGLFPSRNRIISGLSLGVVVTEGAEDSGSLITARYAAEQGRDVFAVPGPALSVLSKGPHALIRQGAVITTNIHDITALYAQSQKTILKKETFETFSPHEQNVLTLLSQEPLDWDGLILKTAFSSSSLTTLLVSLELMRVIYRDELGMYRLTGSA